MTYQQEREVFLADARLILRFAASVLTPSEKAALSVLAIDADSSEKDQAAAERGITRGGLWMAKASGLRKMRRRLAQLGIRERAQFGI